MPFVPMGRGFVTSWLVTNYVAQPIPVASRSTRVIALSIEPYSHEKRSRFSGVAHSQVDVVSTHS
jgi:hypothetical protein